MNNIQSNFLNTNFFHESDNEKEVPSDSRSNNDLSDFIPGYLDKFASFKEIVPTKTDLENTLVTFEKYHNSAPFELFVDADLLDKIKKIDSKLLNGNFNGDKSFIKKIINDIVLFGCLNYVKSEKPPTPDHFTSWSNINVLTPEMVHEILGSLSTEDIIDFSENKYLSHIAPQIYDSATTLQKMVLLNLSNFDVVFRKKIQKDEFFLSIYHRSDLLDWMFACSGSLQQNFLNTCAITIFGQEILSRVSILPEAIILEEKLLEIIERKAKTVSDQKTKTYVEGRLKRVKNVLEDLRKDILKSKQNLPVEEIRSFTLNWHRSMQKLGLLVDPESPRHPTQKICDNMFINIGVMAPVIAFEHVMGKKDNPPSLRMRSQGLDPSKLRYWVLSSLKISINPLANTKMKNEDLLIINESSLNRGKYTKEEKATAVENLWKAVYFKGGLPLENSWHVFFLKAVCYHDQKFFLMNDPLTKDFFVLAFNQLFDYFGKHKIEFSLEKQD